MTTTTYIPTDEEALLALEAQREAEAKRAEIAAQRAAMMEARAAKLAADAAVAKQRVIAADPAARLAGILHDRLGDDVERFAHELAAVDPRRLKAAFASLISMTERRRLSDQMRADATARAETRRESKAPEKEAATARMRAAGIL